MLYIQHTHTHTHFHFLAGRLLCSALRREPDWRLLFLGGCFWMVGESIVSESSGGCCTVVCVFQLVLIDNLCIYTHHTHTHTHNIAGSHTPGRNIDIERGCLSITSPNVSNLLKNKGGRYEFTKQTKREKKT